MSNPIDFDKMTKDFILGEGTTNNPDASSFIQSIKDTLSSLSPRNQRDQKSIEVAKFQLKQLERSVRRMDRDMRLMQEELNEKDPI